MLLCVLCISVFEFSCYKIVEEKAVQVNGTNNVPIEWQLNVLKVGDTLPTQFSGELYEAHDSISTTYLYRFRRLDSWHLNYYFTINNSSHKILAIKSKSLDFWLRENN